MKEAIIVINLKTYKQGKDALKLAKEIEKVDKKIIIGVQPADIYKIVNGTKLRIYSEHVDGLIPGRNTGYILPESIKENGAVGTFLNHSEHKLAFKEIKAGVKRCKEVGLKTMVFAESLVEAKKIEKLRPDLIIYEPSELVAGEISVSTAKPGVIEKIAKSLKTDFLVGAGIKSNFDIQRSLELGAKGIAVSSAITTAKNPVKTLKGLLGR